MEEWCVGFNDREVSICFVVFKPLVFVVDHFVEALKQFSFSTTNLGCIQSSVLKSIHGNMIIWCGIWAKRSIENTELLSEAILKNLTKVSGMATIIDISFFEAYGGDSMDGSCVARFSKNRVISMISVAAKSGGDMNDLSYACLAIFKSRFQKIEGVISGICLKSQNRSTVMSLYVWNSPFYCYSWILNSDHLNSMMPYLDRFSLCIKYDVFQVVNVMDANVADFLDLDHHEEGKRANVAVK
ncbi:uncharacterized protein LOC111495588 isoform X1 [Cucurbita maxima]|uniref:Uncharacterized protein LOC111495588 isoform X1 n=1 Tax=Cucurbita maxima TaxID=3661 RepID=A0A6J1KL93_CUCMA|nr:uncharacterized protein LOC111495588 isoform X1 [Cucurbita maxima]